MAIVIHPYGYGSKLKSRGYAGFGPCFHFPGFHFGIGFLSHTHLLCRVAHDLLSGPKSPDGPMGPESPRGEARGSVRIQVALVLFMVSGTILFNITILNLAGGSDGGRWSWDVLKRGLLLFIFFVYVCVCERPTVQKSRRPLCRCFVAVIIYVFL